MLTLALTSDRGPFGWGVCSDYLVKELSSRTNIEIVNSDNHTKRVRGPVLHTIADILFQPAYSVSGDYNAGYCFFELEPMVDTVKNARSFNHIFCGSTYNMKVLEKCDIFHTSLLVQGVDSDIFNPAPLRKEDGKFIIFSGGKFEYRKGQDLVLAAFKLLMDKYQDMHLVTVWKNQWPLSVETMVHSKHIELNLWGETWLDKMMSLCKKNGIPHERVTHYSYCTQRQLSKLMEHTDIGVFPNRCEGGTNLMLMEYMAKHRPVIASYNSGHADILNEGNAILVKGNNTNRLQPSPRSDMFATWWEYEPEHIAQKIEWAYLNRDRLKTYALAAENSMNHFTWGRTADTVMKVINAHDASAIDYLDHRYMLGDMLTRLGYNGEGAEIGVYSATLSKFVYSRWIGKKIHLIDRWKETNGYHDICNQAQEIQEKLYESVKRTFDGNDDINIIRADSVEAAKQFENDQLDWVYIDADHSYPAVKDDINAWFPKVRIGGLVAGDDYFDGVTHNGTFGVKSAVNEFVDKHGFELKFSADERNPYKSWYFIKTHNGVP